jgi:hypothetical protein
MKQAIKNIWELRWDGTRLVSAAIIGRRHDTRPVPAPRETEVFDPQTRRELQDILNQFSIFRTKTRLVKLPDSRHLHPQTVPQCQGDQ